MLAYCCCAKPHEEHKKSKSKRKDKDKGKKSKKKNKYLDDDTEEQKRLLPDCNTAAEAPGVAVA